MLDNLFYKRIYISKKNFRNFLLFGPSGYLAGRTIMMFYDDFGCKKIIFEMQWKIQHTSLRRDPGGNSRDVMEEKSNEESDPGEAGKVTKYL